MLMKPKPRFKSETETTVELQRAEIWHTLVEKRPSYGTRKDPGEGLGCPEEVVVAEGGLPGILEGRKVDRLQPSGEGRGKENHALA